MENNRQKKLISIISDDQSKIKGFFILEELSDFNCYTMGNELSGYRILFTESLLNNLKEREIEAILLHEYGHIKNRDLDHYFKINMMASIFNGAIIYLLFHFLKTIYLINFYNNYPIIFSFLLTFFSLILSTIFQNRGNLNEEILADKYPIDSGYKLDMKNALLKIWNSSTMNKFDIKKVDNDRKKRWNILSENTNKSKD